MNAASLRICANHAYFVGIPGRILVIQRRDWAKIVDRRKMAFDLPLNRINPTLDVRQLRNMEGRETMIRAGHILRQGHAGTMGPFAHPTVVGAPQDGGHMARE
jgi:hypothetical protein